MRKPLTVEGFYSVQAILALIRALNLTLATSHWSLNRYRFVEQRELFEF